MAPKVLKVASDLVLKASLDLHEQSPADEECFDRMAIRTFDNDFLTTIHIA
jgi:hypothetical protein